MSRSFGGRLTIGATGGVSRHTPWPDEITTTGLGLHAGCRDESWCTSVLHISGGGAALFNRQCRAPLNLPSLRVGALNEMAAAG